ncbi:hypothetical protein LTS17_007468 [Exophiala oligosperma]
MSSTPVLLLLGAGSNLGLSIGTTFSKAGYRVALVARSHEPGLQKNGYFHIRADLGDAGCMPGIFEEVTKNMGIPTVVVYNAVQYKLDDEKDPFATLGPETVSRFHSAMAVNGTTPVIAMHHAIEAFRKLPSDTAKGRSFIFTGNILNRAATPNRLCFGCAKTVCAYGIKMASVMYASEGMRFYYADERTSEGLPVMRDIDGTIAGKVYLDLAEAPEQRPWNYTYLKDGKYQDFEDGREYITVREASTAEFRKGGRD